MSSVSAFQPAVQPPTNSGGDSAALQAQHAPLAVVQPAEGDTVTLSLSARVQHLNLGGDSPSQIAQKLGIPVTTVNRDLGIVTQATATPSVAAANRTHTLPTPVSQSQQTADAASSLQSTGSKSQADPAISTQTSTNN